MGRSEKRAGFGTMRGSLNPKFTPSLTAPNSPKKYDVWLDLTNDALKYWDGSNWVSVLG